MSLATVLGGSNSAGGYVSVGKGNCRLSDLEAALRPGSPVADLTDLTSGIASDNPERQDTATRGLRKLLSKGTVVFLSFPAFILAPRLVGLAPSYTHHPYARVRMRGRAHVSTREACFLKV